GLRLAAPDPYGILALLAGAMLLVLVLLQTRSPRRPRTWLVATVFSAAVTALVLACSGGAQLYLVVSFAALLLQSLLVRWWLRPQAPMRARRGAVLPLRAAAGRAEFGGKASRLGGVLLAGLPGA